MKKINEEVFMDPIYGSIYVDYDVILKIINTTAFQRLRRIKQLSSVSMIYHGAEHSRFSHSLGTYNVARMFLLNPSLNKALNERERLLFLSSALLHDIGHGPHSHTFEDIFQTNHEVLGAKIIKEDNELRKVLNEVDENFAEDISNILLKLGKYPLIEKLISSQLDVDRIDYLLRDAYYTGTPYGNIDLDRIIRVLVVKDDNVYFKESGIHTIENFLINRYHMYFLVYFHRVCRAHEANLENIYLRVKDLIINDYQFNANIKLLKDIIINDEINLNSYLLIDDYYINGLIQSFRFEDDYILKELSNDYLNRKIWNYIDYNKKEVLEIKENINTKYIKYFTKVNEASNLAYAPKVLDGDKINIMLKDGNTSTLYKESEIIKSISKLGSKTDRKFFYRWKNKFLSLKEKTTLIN